MKKKKKNYITAICVFKLFCWTPGVGNAQNGVCVCVCVCVYVCLEREREKGVHDKPGTILIL